MEHNKTVYRSLSPKSSYSDAELFAQPSVLSVPLSVYPKWIYFNTKCSQ